MSVRGRRSFDERCPEAMPQDVPESRMQRASRDPHESLTAFSSRAGDGDALQSSRPETARSRTGSRDPERSRAISRKLPSRRRGSSVGYPGTPRCKGDRTTRDRFETRRSSDRVRSTGALLCPPACDDLDAEGRGRELAKHGDDPIFGPGEAGADLRGIAPRDGHESRAFALFPGLGGCYRGLSPSTGRR